MFLVVHLFGVSFLNTPPPRQKNKQAKQANKRLPSLEDVLFLRGAQTITAYINPSINTANQSQGHPQQDCVERPFSTQAFSSGADLSLLFLKEAIPAQRSITSVLDWDRQCNIQSTTEELRLSLGSAEFSIVGTQISTDDLRSRLCNTKFIDNTHVCTEDLSLSLGNGKFSIGKAETTSHY